MIVVILCHFAGYGQVIGSFRINVDSGNPCGQSVMTT